MRRGKAAAERGLFSSSTAVTAHRLVRSEHGHRSNGLLVTGKLSHHWLEAQRSSRTGSWRIDVSSGTDAGSREMIRMYGVKADEDTSTVEFWLSRNHPEDRKRMLEIFERSKIEKTDYDADYRIALPD